MVAGRIGIHVGARVKTASETAAVFLHQAAEFSNGVGNKAKKLG